MSKLLARVEFKQIKDLYMKIVAHRNVFIEFIHKVRSATRLLIERTQKVFKVEIFERCLIESDPSPRGGFWGFNPPKQSFKPPKLKHETLLIS